MGYGTENQWDSVGCCGIDVGIVDMGFMGLRISRAGIRVLF